jgi:hypothetical protein
MGLLYFGADSQTIGLLKTIVEKVNTMSAEIDMLRTAVQKESDVVQSAIVLLNGISDRIKAAGADTAALAEVAADIDTQRNALAAAVAANTPAEEPPALPPATPPAGP